VNQAAEQVLLALAQQGGGAPAGGCGGGALGSIPMLLLMFVVFYFILIRPQQKRAKEHSNLINSLKKGDEVVTRGGVIGRVAGVADNVVTLEIQEKVRVRVLKSYIDGKHGGAQTVKEAAAKAEKTEAAPTESKS
jgi:preprotein translocase subunit YajC